MIMKFWVLSSSISSSPLVSSIVTLYALILLYVPHQFLRILFSPVLIIAGILLFSLLRLGATQKCREEEEEDDDDENKKKSAEENQKTSTCQQADRNSNETNHSCEPEEEDHNWAVDHESETDSEPETCLSGKRSFEDSFFESWNLRGPLEVIYEEEEEEEEDRIERYASLSRYYPESEEEESEDYSDGEFPATGRFWDLPESLGFQWEEEDREGLIEIALDGNKNNNNKRGLMDFHVEEDNLIEIDLSPARNDTPPASQVLST